ncbi:MAG: hydrolase [Anaerovoracaceae bacterium]
MRKLNPETAALIVIDYQERLLPVIENGEKSEEDVLKLITGARVVGLPVIVTQQYTKGLGETTGKIKEALGVFTPVEKTTFSVFGTDEFIKVLNKSKAKQLIICGIESHVCVQQSVLDALELGYQVFVPEDCVGSRKLNDKKIAGKRMRKEGAIYTTYEAILFELIGGAKSPHFKEISKLVK